MTLRLCDPAVGLHRSWVAACEEFCRAGEQHYAGLVSWPSDRNFAGVDFTAAGLRNPRRFEQLVRFLLEQRDPASPRPRAYVDFTELWIVEEEEFLGRISLRHELNEMLYNWGGHIGYAVRPSARRRGVAGWALDKILDRCEVRGIDPVLVTCDPENEASRRTIEAAGGVYEDTREHKLRFWIDLQERTG